MMFYPLAPHRAPSGASSETTPSHAGEQPTEPRKIGYEKPEYIKARQKVLDSIPSVSIWDSIDRYAGHVALGLFGLAFGSIFRTDNPSGLNSRTTTVLGSTAIGTALLGIYAHYQKRMASEPSAITHMEAYKTAETELMGQSIANALAEKFPNGQPESGASLTHQHEAINRAIEQEVAKQWGANVKAQKQEAEQRTASTSSHSFN